MRAGKSNVHCRAAQVLGRGTVPEVCHEIIRVAVEIEIRTRKRRPGTTWIARCAGRLGPQEGGRAVEDGYLFGRAQGRHHAGRDAGGVENLQDYVVQ